MKAMLLSAGRGSRMKQLTADVPKPLLEIDGKPLIQHHIEQLKHCGITEFVVNLHYLGEKIEKFLGNGKKFDVRINYLYEKQLLGMGGGVFNALTLLGNDPFIVMSNDVVTDFDFNSLIQKSVEYAHLVLVDNPSFHPKGDFSLDGDVVTEKTQPTYNYSGFGVFTAKLFEQCKLGSFGIAPVLQPFIHDRKITGEYYNGLWLNVNTPEELIEAEAYLQKNNS